MRKGYSLLVVIIALAIFATGILSIVTLLPSGHKSVRRAIFLSRAAIVAERELNRIRVCYSEADSPSPPENFFGSDPEGFRWEGSVKRSPSDGDGDTVYSITLDVSWLEAGKLEKETFETRFTRR